MPDEAARPGAAELTALLAAARAGDPDAAGKAFAAVYRDLHELARAKLRHHRTITLLDTTALVHESYERLVGAGRLAVEDRRHFFAYAARAMRSVIVDAARARLAARRGGGRPDATLDSRIADPALADDGRVVAVDDALADLAKVNPRLAQVVELRFFGGLTEAEVAAALSLSERTVKRDWEKARMLLAAALG